MAIPTNQKPTIYRNKYEHTGPGTLRQLFEEERSVEFANFGTRRSDKWRSCCLGRIWYVRNAIFKMVPLGTRSWYNYLYTRIIMPIFLIPLTAKLFNLNFHPLEVVSRWRDPQLQVSEKYSDLTKWRSTVFKYCWLMSHCIFYMFKGGIKFANKNENPNICSSGG